ncbi:MAG: tetratricopeptide repeat protein [Planctomycetota bacterium]
MRIGHYEVHDELARGGMGVVYRATDTRSGARVVVKLLKAPSEGARRRLLREAEALGRLVHPSVLTLYDAGLHEGQPFLVLPYVSGESVQDRLDRGGPLPPDEAREVALQVGEGLAAAHALGLLHRDVKPANVLVDRRLHGQVKLADFGLVLGTALEGEEDLRLSASGQFLGTPGYAPPEQGQGRLAELGPAADVYGLGGLLYAMLSGRPPRGWSSLPQALDGFEASVEALPKQVPSWLADLVTRCLERAPQDRPPLEEVLRELRAGAASPRASTRRRGALPLLAVAGALLLGVGLLRSARPGAEPSPSAPTPAPAAGPEDARALGEQGAAWVQEERPQEALEVLERALELDPTDALAHANRGRALVQLGRIEDAILAFDRALELDPGCAPALAGRGGCFNIQRRPQEALSDLNRAIALDTRSAHAYAERGACLHNLERYGEALADFTRAIELEPTLPGNLAARGHVRTQLEDLEGAIEDFTRAIELGPTAASYAGRGVCYGDLGRDEEALADFTRAIELDDTRARTHVNQGLLYSKLGDDARAVEAYTRSIELDPGSALHYFQRGLSLARLRRYPEALADLDRAVELRPERARNHFVRGMIHAALEEHEAAVVDFTHALELDDTLAAAYGHRGASYEALGRQREADADLERARALQAKRGATRD